MITEDEYLAAVASLVAQHGVDRYFAHRKEARDKLARIADLGLRIEMPELPLEVAIRQGAVGRLVISFPSTVVHTLPVVLADTAAELLVCDIDPELVHPRCGRQLLSLPRHRHPVGPAAARTGQHRLLSRARRCARR